MAEDQIDKLAECFRIHRQGLSGLSHDLHPMVLSKSVFSRP